MQNELAIVIPAYKSEYLKSTLTSIAQQSDQRFNLYIFDDASPFDLDQIIRNSDLGNGYRYHRFDRNMGGKSIVGHWTRCIERVGDEKWIWLFSDDDLMDENCVEAFYHAKESTPGAVAYRFNTHKISESGSLIRENIYRPEFTAVSFLQQKLTYTQESYVVETIFSKDHYQKIGGIPDLPLAWASDDLFTVKLAMEGKVVIIDSALVYWRYSETNISGKKDRKSAVQKLCSSRKFVLWIYRHKNILGKLNPDDLALRWYVRQIRSLRDQLHTGNEVLAVLKLWVHDPRVLKLYLRMKWDRSKMILWLKKYLS